MCSYCARRGYSLLLFFLNDTATTEIYTLSLHDALPICPREGPRQAGAGDRAEQEHGHGGVAAHRVPLLAGPSSIRSARQQRVRKSTRLNSSHTVFSYAVFCLKKKKKEQDQASRVVSREK